MNADRDQTGLRGEEPVEQSPVEETNELIEYFKKQVDREALRENLKLTPSERLEKMERQFREKHRDKIHLDNTPSYPPVAPLRESTARYTVEDLVEEAPAEATNDLIEAFKKDVDRTLLIENLKLTVPQRMEKFEANMQMLYDLRHAVQSRLDKDKK